MESGGDEEDAHEGNCDWQAVSGHQRKKFCGKRISKLGLRNKKIWRSSLGDFLFSLVLVCGTFNFYAFLEKCLSGKNE